MKPGPSLVAIWEVTGALFLRFGSAPWLMFLGWTVEGILRYLVFTVAMLSENMEHVMVEYATLVDGSSRPRDPVKLVWHLYFIIKTLRDLLTRQSTGSMMCGREIFDLGIASRRLPLRFEYAAILRVKMGL